MRLNVRLFSILRKYVPDYDAQRGLAVELPDGACVSDLVAFLNIPAENAPVVACNGRLLKRDDPLEEGSSVSLFQPMAGG